MTPTLIGGPVNSRAIAEPQDVEIPGFTRIMLRYPPFQPSEGSITYTVAMPPLRLRAILRRTDEGFVAEVPELRVLGYGEHADEAVDDLRDAVKDYLTIVRDSGGRLAPSVAHHAEYVALLDAPEESWFAAVVAHSEYAADVE
jgi:predicted RNase H-like HicB family nuclease